MFREVYETYHQANEQHNQQELLQHGLQQEQQKFNLSKQEQNPPLFQIYQSPIPDKSTSGPAFQVYQSPAVNKSTVSRQDGEADSSNESFLNDLWKSSCDREEVSFIPRPNVSKFSIHQSSSLGTQPQIQPKGSAMKTPFR